MVAGNRASRDGPCTAADGTNSARGPRRQSQGIGEIHRAPGTGGVRACGGDVDTVGPKQSGIEAPVTTGGRACAFTGDCWSIFCGGAEGGGMRSGAARRTSWSGNFRGNAVGAGVSLRAVVRRARFVPLDRRKAAAGKGT